MSWNPKFLSASVLTHAEKKSFCKSIVKFGLFVQNQWWPAIDFPNHHLFLVGFSIDMVI